MFESEAPLGTCEFLRRFFSCESGATTIEYAMIVAGIGATLTFSISTWANAVEGQFVRARSVFP